MARPAAAVLCYEERRCTRRDAAPGRIQDALLGRGGVQGLDDAAHRHRTRLFLSLMTPERIGRLGELADDWWRAYARRWVARTSCYEQGPRACASGGDAAIFIPPPGAQAGDG